MDKIFSHCIPYITFGNKCLIFQHRIFDNSIKCLINSQLYSGIEVEPIRINERFENQVKSRFKFHHPDMARNSILNTVQNIRRNKVQIGINLTRLSLDFPCLLFISLWIKDKFRDDKSLPNRNNLRIITAITPNKGYGKLGIKKYEITNKGELNFNCQYYEN